jgi:hypothetical protein
MNPLDFALVADENIAPELVAALRERRIDVCTLHELGLSGAEVTAPDQDAGDSEGGEWPRKSPHGQSVGRRSGRCSPREGASHNERPQGGHGHSGANALFHEPGGVVARRVSVAALLNCASAASDCPESLKSCPQTP